MAKMMYVPMVGVVENMSYIKCPHCDEKIRIYGNEKSKETIEKNGVKVLAELPIDPELAKLVDAGEIEEYNTDALNDLISEIEKF